MIYVFLSPYADYQREFLDRVRINTIRHHQVFFPIPFAEFNPVVHKNYGIFDENDFKAFSVYGADYTSLRSKLSQQKDGEEEQEEDIINMFLASLISMFFEPLNLHCECIGIVGTVLT
uniref:Hexosyltransferase n=1 Tax=Ditylenchus dipsaci TaxID=166011 RepID=A0A915D3A2_9BILA